MRERQRRNLTFSDLDSLTGIGTLRLRRLEKARIDNKGATRRECLQLAKVFQVDSETVLKKAGGQ